jgi:tyrosine-protein kinase Etk/Wzc
MRVGDRLRGVGAVLTGAASLDDELTAVQPRDGVSYELLPMHGMPGTPAAMLAGDEFAGLIAAARACADIVLIETAPVERLTQWAPVARACGHVVLVTDRATRSEAASARRALEDFAASAAGIVIVPWQDLFTSSAREAARQNARGQVPAMPARVLGSVSQAIGRGG